MSEVANEAIDFRPWVERHRPNTLDDIVAHDEIRSTLLRMMESHNLPHLLFYGPPGTGKTSTIHACARFLFGTHANKGWVLERNASDDRGIDVVRSEIKDFASTATMSSNPFFSNSIARHQAHSNELANHSRESRHPHGRDTASLTNGADDNAATEPNVESEPFRSLPEEADGNGKKGQSALPRRGVAFKLVILDEADHLTHEAQAALRRVVERFTKNVRFCFICNAVQKIIPALQSRCTRFRFAPIRRSLAVARLLAVAAAEAEQQRQVNLETLGKEIGIQKEAALSAEVGEEQTAKDSERCEKMRTSHCGKRPVGTKDRESEEKATIRADESGAIAAFRVSNGDLRRALNIFQSTAFAHQGVITAETVYATTGMASPTEVKAMVEMMLETPWESAHRKMKEMTRGLSMVDVVRELHSVVMRLALPQECLFFLIGALADVETNAAASGGGGNEGIARMAVVAAFHLVRECISRKVSLRSLLS